MTPLIQEVPTRHTPASLTRALLAEPGLVLLESALSETRQGRYSLLTARPFLAFAAYGSRCEIHEGRARQPLFGNPWQILDSLMLRYEVLDQVDFPFPLGGAFGFWGYDLRRFVEPKLSVRLVNDLEVPDCSVGFYDSLVVFDHQLDKTWIVSTGLRADGSRDRTRARARAGFWRGKLESAPEPLRPGPPMNEGEAFEGMGFNISRAEFLGRVRRALAYIQAGDIYQVNLAQRIEVNARCDSWRLYERLSAISPAPYAAYLDYGRFQLVSSSPELFLRLSGEKATTRPIKGTRPRSRDPTRDAQLSYELQTSPKEMAELVMITDLLRNDLGRVCQYGSVQVPELVRLERYPQVQHLVSTVEGQLRSGLTHLDALAACFPGGSITGAPKFRAMEIIEELEPLSRGPYTGAIGYLGFNRESQLSIAIRMAIATEQKLRFYTGAGIVAESVPEAEYDETLHKAGGFLAAISSPDRGVHAPDLMGGSH